MHTLCPCIAQCSLHKPLGYNRQHVSRRMVIALTMLAVYTMLSHVCVYQEASSDFSSILSDPDLGTMDHGLMHFV